MEILDIATWGTSLTANSVSYALYDWQIALQKRLGAGSSVRPRVYNLGTGGWSSANGLSNVSRLNAYRAKVVLIEFLMNDCETSRAISTAQSKQNHLDMIAAIRAARPDTQIFLMTMNSPLSAAQPSRPDIASYNARYSEIAAADPTVGLIDISPDWSGSTTAEIPDSIHPTTAAQLAVAVPVISSALSPLVG